MQQEKSTAKVLEELNKVRSFREAETVIGNDSNFSNRTFREYFNEYMIKKGISSPARIIKDSGLSRQYAYDVINGVKNGSRDKIIALCYAAGMSLNEVNHALTYSGHSQLYAKDKRDAVLIMAFNMKKETGTLKTVTDLDIYLDENNLKPLNDI